MGTTRAELIKERQRLEYQLKRLDEKLDRQATYVSIREDVMNLIHDTFRESKAFTEASEFGLARDKVGPLGGISHQVKFLVDGEHYVIVNIYCDEKTDQAYQTMAQERVRQARHLTAPRFDGCGYDY